MSHAYRHPRTQAELNANVMRYGPQAACAWMKHERQRVRCAGPTQIVPPGSFGRGSFGSDPQLPGIPPQLQVIALAEHERLMAEKEIEERSLSNKAQWLRYALFAGGGMLLGIVVAR